METPPPGLVGLPAPSGQQLPLPVVEGLLALRAALPGTHFKFQRSYHLASARNELARLALDLGLPWLLLHDTDMSLPPDAVRDLWATGLPIVGAVYRASRHPHQVCAGHFNGDPVSRSDTLTIGTAVSRPSGPRGRYLTADDLDGSVQHVDFVGGGAVFLRREALKEMMDPWWEGTGALDTSDIKFCEHARARGLEIGCHTGAPATHHTARALHPGDDVDDSEVGPALRRAGL